MTQWERAVEAAAKAITQTEAERPGATAGELAAAALRAAIRKVVGDGDGYDVQGAIEDGTEPEVLREAVFNTLEKWRAAQEER